MAPKAGDWQARCVVAGAELGHMTGDTNTSLKRRKDRDPPSVTANVAEPPRPPDSFRAVNTGESKHETPTEPKARGQRSRNRPANPLTCQASHLLCLDANALGRPWFREISGQGLKKGGGPALAFF